MILKLRIEQRGGHVHADVFAGVDGDHLALSGRLVFTREEWSLLYCEAVELEVESPDARENFRARVVVEVL